jgi:hypothetical protein
VAPGGPARKKEMPKESDGVHADQATNGRRRRRR